MILSFQDFFTKYNGQGNVGNTPENIGQCVGLCEKWWDNLQTPHVWGNAYQLLDNADKNAYDIILNTPDNFPLPGDVVVFSVAFNNGNGHCGITIETADVNSVKLFEQNDPIGSPCHIDTYTYTYVLGWIRPKQPSYEQQLADCNKIKDQHYNDLQDALHQISDLKQQLQDCQNKLISPPIVPASGFTVTVPVTYPKSNVPLQQGKLPTDNPILKFIKGFLGL